MQLPDHHYVHSRQEVWHSWNQSHSGLCQSFSPWYFHFRSMTWHQGAALIQPVYTDTPISVTASSLAGHIACSVSQSLTAWYSFHLSLSPYQDKWLSVTDWLPGHSSPSGTTPWEGEALKPLRASLPVTSMCCEWNPWQFWGHCNRMPLKST